MPRYVYKCKECNAEITVVCSIKDYFPITLCECGELAERKPNDLVCGLSIDNTNSFSEKITKYLYLNVQRIEVRIFLCPEWE